jgi:hypothetical protein
MIRNGIYFHGGAGSFPYYLGIARYLQENYDLSDVSFAGCSAGCFPAIALAAKICDGTFYKRVLLPSVKDIQKSNKRNGLMFKDAMLGSDWINHLKKYVKIAVIDSGNFDIINQKCSLLVTNVSVDKVESKFIRGWNSADDLIECCITSAWIPVIFGGIFKEFRKGDCVDGGIGNIFSNKMNNPDYNHNWLHIDLGTFGRFQNDIFTTLHNFISLTFSANEDYVLNLMKQGYTDAKNNQRYFKNFTKL